MRNSPAGGGEASGAEWVAVVAVEAVAKRQRIAEVCGARESSSVSLKGVLSQQPSVGGASMKTVTRAEATRDAPLREGGG